MFRLLSRPRLGYLVASSLGGSDLLGSGAAHPVTPRIGMGGAASGSQQSVSLTPSSPRSSPAPARLRRLGKPMFCALILVT